MSRLNRYQHFTGWLLTATLLLVLTAAPALAATVSKIAAVVNDTIITTWQLDQRLAKATAQNPQLAAGDDAARQQLRRQTLDALIEEELVMQRAQQLKLVASDDEVNAAIDDVQQQNRLTRLQLIAALEQQGMSFEEYRSNLKTQLTQYKVLGKEVQSKVDVSSQELRSYYEEHLDDYRGEAYVHIAYLTFPLAADADAGVREALSAEATKSRERLQAGDSIADLLVTYPHASGGDMGKLSETDLASDFATAVEPLATGEVSDVVDTGDGLYLFRMIERNPGTPQPLEEVRPQIEELLLEQNREKLFKEWQQKLREAAYVDIRI